MTHLPSDDSSERKDPGTGSVPDAGDPGSSGPRTRRVDGVHPFATGALEGLLPPGGGPVDPASPRSRPGLRGDPRAGRERETLGRGNHFLELQIDDDGEVWLMVHSGSRAMGQAIRAHHLARSSRSNTGLRHLDADSDAGQGYLGDVAWALDYAAENRVRMAREVASILEERLGYAPRWSRSLDCHHNFVRKERHLGRDLWVHRKGAISARREESGIIPGSAGSASFHVTGRGHENALCSSSHGAGRVLSRSEARRRISCRQLHRQMAGVYFDMEASRRLVDEAPGAYKDIGKVMRAQKELTCIVRRLHPLLSYKAV